MDSDFYSIFYESEKKHIEKIIMQILTDRGKDEYLDWLRYTEELDDSFLTEKAGKIAEMLREEKILPPMDMEPFVYIDFSEHLELERGDVFSLFEADELFRRLDYQVCKEKKENKVRGYDKTQFELVYLADGELRTYQGRQDFGDGDGSLITHIESCHQFYLKTEEGRDFFDVLSKEQAENIYRNSRYVVEEFLPEMKYFCNLAKIEKAIQEERDIELKELLISAQYTARLAYHKDLLAYVKESRIALNSGDRLPQMPDIQDYIQDTQIDEYRNQVMEDIQTEAVNLGMTVEEYTQNGYRNEPKIYSR